MAPAPAGGRCCGFVTVAVSLRSQPGGARGGRSRIHVLHWWWRGPAEGAVTMRTELVGRELELAALTDCLAATVAGRPQLVLCQGEAGIGKTRLAGELVALAAAKGALGVWGLAADAWSAPPYWPWWQVFRAVASTVDLATISRERRLDAELARLAPDVFSSPEAQRGSARGRTIGSGSSMRWHACCDRSVFRPRWS